MQGSQMNETHTLQKFTIVDLSLQQAFTATKSTLISFNIYLVLFLLWTGSELHGTIL
jgi:preprotein translocase subunit SecF